MSDAFRSVPRTRRIPEQSALFAESRLRFSACGAENEKRGWARPVPQFVAQKRRNAVRPIAAGRTTAIRVRATSSSGQFCSLGSLFSGVLYRLQSRIEQSKFFG